MKNIVLGLVIWLSMICVANATTLDFEGIPENHHSPHLSPYTLGDYYPGVTFGPHTYVRDAGTYDNLHYPAHSGISVLSVYNSSELDIVFDNYVSDFSLWYTNATQENNIPDEFELKAYSDATTTNLLGTVVGHYNWGSNSEIALDYDNIMAVKISGAPGHFTLDDITYTPVSPVPEPTTIFLLSSGLIGLMGFRKCKK